MPLRRDQAALFDVVLAAQQIQRYAPAQILSKVGQPSNFDCSLSLDRLPIHGKWGLLGERGSRQKRLRVETHRFPIHCCPSLPGSVQSPTLDRFPRPQELDRTQLESNDEKQAAILYRIIVIGEATKRISVTFREQHPDIAWKEIAGMRDRITHKYDQVNLDVVWDVVQNKIPQLLAQIEPLLPAQ